MILPCLCNKGLVKPMQHFIQHVESNNYFICSTDIKERYWFSVATI